MSVVVRVSPVPLGVRSGERLAELERIIGPAEVVEGTSIIELAAACATSDVGAVVLDGAPPGLLKAAVAAAASLPVLRPLWRATRNNRGEVDRVFDGYGLLSGEGRPAPARRGALRLTRRRRSDGGERRLCRSGLRPGVAGAGRRNIAGAAGPGQEALVGAERWHAEAGRTPGLPMRSLMACRDDGSGRTTHPCRGVIPPDGSGPGELCACGCHDQPRREPEPCRHCGAAVGHYGHCLARTSAPSSPPPPDPQLSLF